MDKNKSITVIGAGHLGSAVIKGLIKAGQDPKKITISNRDPQKSARLVQELGVLSAETNRQAAEHANLIILAVKPQFMHEVCKEIAPIMKQNQVLVISLAGVVAIESITTWLDNKNLSVIRVMTNIATEFCKGSSALFANTATAEEQKTYTENLFNKVGYTFWAKQEALLDTLTAPIGCAPAYVFLFLEALQQAAISRGIPSEQATTIALESVLGAAELAKNSGLSFSQLRAGVTTPQGVTEHSLQKISFDDFFVTFKTLFAAVEERIEAIQHSFKNK